MLQLGMNCIIIVSKVFTTFLHYTIILLDQVSDRLVQIPEHEFMHWLWYRTPGILQLYEIVLQNWLVIRTKPKDGDIVGIALPTVGGLKSRGS